MILPPCSVLIIGGGEFGLASAAGLLKSNYKDHASLITIIDRSADPPSIDAASYDYNKIVRSDYSDPLYSQLGRKAIQAWQSPNWSPYYNNSGIIILSSDSDSQQSYVEESLRMNPQAIPLLTPKEIQSRIPDSVEKANFEGNVAYWNPNGGWGAATDSMRALAFRLRTAGVNFVQGKVESLIYSEKECVGVRLENDEEIIADFVIVAAGAWSSKLLPELESELIPSGQFVGTILLSEEEVEQYKDVPVILALDTGFYCFPPKGNIIKFAIHGGGYTNESGPRTILSKDGENDQIPKECIAILRAGLQRCYPGLAEKPFHTTRLCWYTESSSSNFIISHLSDTLFIASAGSGHGFKFAPIMGDLIESVLNKAGEKEDFIEELKLLWSIDNVKNVGTGDKSRGGTKGIRRKVLKIKEMAKLIDLTNLN